jgi:hypothetical protein
MYVMTFSDSSLPPVLPEDAAPVAGSVLLPGDAGYDDERAVCNLNHELVPAVIVVPESCGRLLVKSSRWLRVAVSAYELEWFRY